MFMIMFSRDPVGYSEDYLDDVCNKPILLSSVDYYDHNILYGRVMYCGFYIRNSYVVLLEKVG